MSGKGVTPVDWRKVRITGGFWHAWWERNRTVTLPFEFEQLKKVGTLESYQWEWDPNAPPKPWRIWVGDIPKWIEAAAYTLGTCPDLKLAELAETAVQSLLKGQKADGYLYSNPIAPEQRWTNLRDRHELYDVGHAMEGAVAYYEATGRRAFLDAMCRHIDLLRRTFGRGPGLKRGYDGHEEIELALLRMYRATGDSAHLDLARYFVDERGTQPYYFDEEARARGEDPQQNWVHRMAPDHPYLYLQAHQPVREQSDAVGHSVRAMYLYSAMADLGVETGDPALVAACRRLWRSVVRRRMYVTGGVGSTPHGEAFTFDYDLPNETGYAETCAAIGLVLFAHRMLQVEADGEYADVMERALYNGVLSGLSLDGTRFFYANHLTVFPRASQGASDHVAASRREWFGCACCPPNIARTIAGIGRFMYSQRQDGLYVNLYGESEAEAEVGRRSVRISQKTQYPWDGAIRLTLDSDCPPARFTLALRIPGWCRKASVKVNGKSVAMGRVVKKGYAHIQREWARGDVVELDFAMPVERIEANPGVRMDCGKVALQRGPVVFCLEQVDNGADLADIFLPRSSALRAEYRPRLLGGTVVVRGKAERRTAPEWKDALYRPQRSRTKSVDITAVPYAVWANRKPGEMIVWVRGD